MCNEGEGVEGDEGLAEHTKEELFILREQWYEESKQCETLEEAHEFAKRLLIETHHSYSSVVYAVAAVANAVAWTGGAKLQGITGFQAGAVMWEFMSVWNNVDGPARLLRYEHLLYPQYDHKFDKTISSDTWGWLQEQAREKLAEVEGTDRGHPRVIARWQSIADGNLPAGFTVEDE